MLLARRLVEAGVSFIQLNWTRMPGDTNDSPAWDTHNKNADRLKNHLMPIMDAAYSTLLEDLAERGLLDSTLVVWGGEFGRTPHHNGVGVAIIGAMYFQGHWRAEALRVEWCMVHQTNWALSPAKVVLNPKTCTPRSCTLRV